MDNYSYPEGLDTVSAPWNKSDVSDDDYAKAAEYLADDILDGKPWDENLEGYRLDMLVEFEQIMLDNEDDKLGRMQDVMHKKIRSYAEDAVQREAWAQEYLDMVFEDY